MRQKHFSMPLEDQPAPTEVDGAHRYPQAPQLPIIEEEPEQPPIQEEPLKQESVAVSSGLAVESPIEDLKRETRRTVAGGKCDDSTRNCLKPEPVPMDLESARKLRILKRTSITTRTDLRLVVIQSSTGKDRL